MQEFLLRFLIAGSIMAVLDALWLSVVASKFYKEQLGTILLAKPNLLPAVLFYVIYVIGVVLFVLSPALEKQSWSYALGFGALFGLVTYATYDLTNLSTIQGFSAKVVVVDMLWGAVLTGIVAGSAYLILR